MPKDCNILSIAIFFIIVLVLWTGLMILPGPDVEQLPANTQGSYDLTEYDFTDTVYVTAPVWESWPNKLYGPEELDSAEDSVSEQSIDYTKTQVVTYRLRLNLPNGGSYGLSACRSQLRPALVCGWRGGR